MSKKQDPSLFEKYNIKWILAITLWTFILAIIFSILAENLVNNLNILLAFITLIIIIVIGIIFDIIGIAVTRAEETPFHSMAAKRIKEARIAIYLVRHAGEVSNFCNDVVGDISGIVSGAIGANLIYKLAAMYKFENITLLSILITASIASLTVGGKALGKSIAHLYYEKIVIKLAKTINLIENILGINIISKEKGNKANKR